MRRTNWKTVSTLIAMITLAGCSERVVAPDASTSDAPAFSPGLRPSLRLNSTAAANTVTTFTVNPSGGVFMIGRNAVLFPKGSICEPGSTYGPGTWDTECKPLSVPVTITAETRVQDGRTWIDFSPALRFVPTNDPSRYVLVFMSTPDATTSTDLSAFNIYYTPSIGGALVDEAAADASLRTYVDTKLGVSIRRIKHFSGYTSSSGRTCEPLETSTDPTTGGSGTDTETATDCTPTEPPPAP